MSAENTQQVQQYQSINPTQSYFIEGLIQDQQQCTIFLVNGIKLINISILSQDNSVLIVRDKTSKKMIYKHNISTVTIDD